MSSNSLGTTLLQVCDGGGRSRKHQCRQPTVKGDISGDLDRNNLEESCHDLISPSYWSLLSPSKCVIVSMATDLSLYI